MKIDPDYLRRTAESPAIRALKGRAHELLDLKPGNVVVDLGCGPAIDTIGFARVVGPGGMVMGVDADEEIVLEANRVAVREGVGAMTRHLFGSATAIPVADGQADACFSERLLQHVSWNDAQRVAAEILRVVRPGGRVVVIDSDWGTFSIAAVNPWLERRVVQEHILGFANPFSGRYLLALFRSSGLTNVDLQSVSIPLTLEAVEFLLHPALQRGIAAGRITAVDARRWYEALHASGNYGFFFAHLSMVLMSGTRP